MKNKALMPLVLVAAAALPLAIAQERVKKKESKDFAATHAELGEAWKAGRYSQSLELTRELLTLISKKQREVILAAMPAAPEGWERIAEEEDDEAQANPFGAAVAASMGSVVTARYEEASGNGRIEITVTAGSPLAQMFKMWVANPQMLGPDAELVKYEKHNAVLKKEGEGDWNLQLLLGDDFLEARAYDASDDLLLKLMSQAALDRLASALSS